MIVVDREPSGAWGILLASAAVGVVLSPLLAGYEPVGGDPDRIFRPIKAELARALHEGRLPLWSDRFGIGVPLLAESHAAVLYPPNHVLYRAFDVSTAYRLSMWLHYVACAGFTAAYARRLGIKPGGAALSGVAFALCGFQAIHSSHEWAYHTAAYLPLLLIFADRYAEKGRLADLGGLAIAWGAQWTLGHFQVQTWSGGLALASGAWRIVADRRPLGRLLGLGLGLGLGVLIASPQLGPSWELAKFVGRDRHEVAKLFFYSFPPEHWVEPFAPRLFRTLPGDPESSYWFGLKTTGFESCFYLGTISIVLAVAGLGAGRRRGLGFWWLTGVTAFTLATMTRWWPAGYTRILAVPGLGLFRCPTRYTLIAAFAVAMMAGSGLDRALDRGRWWSGVASSVALGAFGIAWTCWRFAGVLGVATFESKATTPLVATASAWLAAIAVLGLWRAGKLGGWAPVLATAIELGLLFYNSTTAWGRPVPLPESSPTFLALREEPNLGLIAGPLDNLPVRAGFVAGKPYLGFPLPIPNDWLVAAQERRPAIDPTGKGERDLLRELGVSHGIWPGPAPLPGFIPLVSNGDPALDRLAYRPRGAPVVRPWTLYRLEDPSPPFLVFEGDRPQVGGSKIPVEVAWDGKTATIGPHPACGLLVRRTFYPGWSASIDGGPPKPVVDFQAQVVFLPEGGPTRIEYSYWPTGWTRWIALSATGTAVALLLIGFGARGRDRLAPREGS